MKGLIILIVAIICAVDADRIRDLGRGGDSVPGQRGGFGKGRLETTVGRGGRREEYGNSKHGYDKEGHDKRGGAVNHGTAHTEHNSVVKTTVDHKVSDVDVGGGRGYKDSGRKDKGFGVNRRGRKDDLRSNIGYGN